MKYKAVFSPEAKEDAKAIRSYLLQFSKNAPARFTSSLRESISRVKDNPKMYEQYRYQPHYRRIPLDDYLVFYEIDETQKTIYIFRILHGARNIKDIYNLDSRNT